MSDIAAIYAALRDTTGAPFVDPLFRHMAAVDGCLPWAWTCLEPFYRGGALHEAGARIATIGQQIAMGRVDIVVGLKSEAIADTLNAHIRATPLALIALLALQRACAGGATTAPAPGGPARMTPFAHVLPIGDLASVPETSREKLRTLTSLLCGDEDADIPPLLLHFAAWPAALEAIAKTLRALIRADALNAVAVDMETVARRAADRLALAPPMPPDAAIVACIDRLAEQLPGRMTRCIVLATALRQALG